MKTNPKWKNIFYFLGYLKASYMGFLSGEDSFKQKMVVRSIDRGGEQREIIIWRASVFFFFFW